MRLKNGETQMKIPLTITAVFSYNLFCCEALRRVVRVVEGARLESVCTGNCIEGSNPLLSAKIEIAILCDTNRTKKVEVRQKFAK